MSIVGHRWEAYTEEQAARAARSGSGGGRGSGSGGGRGGGSGGSEGGRSEGGSGTVVEGVGVGGMYETNEKALPAGDAFRTRGVVTVEGAPTANAFGHYVVRIEETGETFEAEIGALGLSALEEDDAGPVGVPDYFMPKAPAFVAEGDN